ncbi:SAM-dependent methyltransferase [Streptomyces zagrosensis]|uniref:SAM-dependent methyltransferase n=2 Tax=Streptomyces zagrosensis TaxID=1042984 RepID=A0A7W9QGD6_9ACTN|nr:SAM-dependent methyltransferase [Streptomyces zagrosensis]
MADLARHRVVEADVATFEAWGPAGRTFDAVVAGQAWHWIDPAAGTAKVALALRPGGQLAVLWNVFRLPVTVAEACAAVYRRVMPDAPVNLPALTQEAKVMDAYQALVTKTADAIQGAGGFSTPQQ